MLQVCLDLGFPVFTLEKSSLILQDIGLLKKINKESAVISGFSIIVPKTDKNLKIWEPQAFPIKERFRAMEKFAKAGILTGTVFMPVLPYIYDTEKNIEAVVKSTKDAGGKFVLWGGLTLEGLQQVRYYKILRQHLCRSERSEESQIKQEPSLQTPRNDNCDIITKYNQLYRGQYSPVDTSYVRRIHLLFKKYCDKYNLLDYIHRPVKFYPKELQFNKKIAGEFLTKARDIQLLGESKYRFWSYQKAGWTIDELDESIEKIYNKKGIAGLQKLPDIGEKIAEEIEKQILKREQ